MAEELIREFDFETPSEWDLLGDAEIASDVLTLDDPVTQLPWTCHKWSSVPPESGDDRALADGVVYLAENNGDDYEFGDHSFVFWLKLSASVWSYLYILNHYTHEVGNAAIKSAIRRTSTEYLQWHVRRTNGFLQTKVELNSVTSYGDPPWADNTFRKVVVSYRGNRLSVFIDGVITHETCGLDLDDTDGGTVGFDTLYSVGTWILGGGPPSQYASPYVAERKIGGAQLKVVNAWDLDNVIALGRIAIVGDLTGGGDIVLPAELAYNHYTGAAWTGWITVPADGDLSGLSVGSGKKLLVGITDGSTGGMDTMSDETTAQGVVDYAPDIHKIVVGYTANVGTTVAHRRNAVQAGSRRGDYD
ncbi:hypothetical protein KAW64_07260 [bacterium]|nr:hypothetical protein [bacterium]